MSPKISVCLATYNPRQDYLERTLEGVRKQTLPHDQWEFILIDNNSQPPLEGRVGLSGLPLARIVVEKEPGLSPARRRAFSEAKGDLIVNLDDDMVLATDYLTQVLALQSRYPFLGAFGCQIEAEFEIPPEREASEYYAAERKVPQALWSNDPAHYASSPWGAGSVVHRQVANCYANKISSDPRFAAIGRKPGKLLGCEDDDIAMTACDLGFAKGVFPQLKVTHLIPKTKMTDEFQIKNAEGKGFSSTLLEFLRSGRLPPRQGFFARINRLYRLARMSPRRRAEEKAIQRGVAEAVQEIVNKGWIQEKKT